MSLVSKLGPGSTINSSYNSLDVGKGISCVFLLHRIENVTRSPLFSHVATTIQGLGTIRAYKKEGEFLRE